MTDQHPENNQVLHELLGKCWHEIYGEIEDDGIHRSFCIKCDKDRSYGSLSCNPDYADDPRLVLEGMREMLGLEILNDFLVFVGYKTEGISAYGQIPVDLILDRTGRLAILATEFLNDFGFGYLKEQEGK